jgi:hypothetical protein
VDREENPPVGAHRDVADRLRVLQHRFQPASRLTDVRRGRQVGVGRAAAEIQAQAAGGKAPRRTSTRTALIRVFIVQFQLSMKPSPGRRKSGKNCVTK